MLGLSLILIIGSLIILLDFFLEAIIQRFQDWKPFHQSKNEKAADLESSPATPTATLSTTQTATSSATTQATTSSATTQAATSSETNINLTIPPPSPDTKLLKRAEWDLSSTLQLQRLAHEGIGAGTWKRTESETLVTLPNQPLGVLDFEEPPTGHPYLAKPVTGRDVDVEVKPALQEGESTPDNNNNAVTEPEMTEVVDVNSPGRTSVEGVH